MRNTIKNFSRLALITAILAVAAGHVMGREDLTKAAFASSSSTINAVGTPVKVKVTLTPAEALIDSIGSKSAKNGNGVDVDSVGFSGVYKQGQDSVKYTVTPAGIVGIRRASSTKAVNATNIDSVTGSFDVAVDSVWYGEQHSDSVSSIKVKAGANVDELEIFSLGLRTGTVTITAHSANGGTVIGSHKVTVSGNGARTAVVPTSIVKGINSGKKSGADSGQVLIKWNHVSAFSDYEVFVVDTSIANGPRFSGVGDSVFYYDSLTATKKISDEPGAKSTERKAVITGLANGKGKIVVIRGIYGNAANALAGAALGSRKSLYGPAVVCTVTTPITRSSSSNVIQYLAPAAAKTYNGKPQDIGRATLISGATDRTGDGIDPWVTTYRFKLKDDRNHPKDWGSWKLWEELNEKDKPIDAGTCSTQVRYENSAYIWERTAVFYIQPKTLPTGVIKMSPTKPSYTYNGDYKQPDYDVRDAAIPDRELKIGEDYTAAQGSGAAVNKNAAYVNNTNVGRDNEANGPKIAIIGIGNYTGRAEAGFTITQRNLALDTANSHVASYVYNGGTNVTASAVDINFEPSLFDESGTGLLQSDIPWFTANAGDSAFTFKGTVTNGNASVTTATVTVTLGTTGLARNYKFVSGKNTFKKPVEITKKTDADIDSTDFKWSIPEGHLYTGQPRGIGTVTFGNTSNSASAKIVVLYDDDDSLKPIEAKSYRVTARIDTIAGKSANYEHGITFPLGEYEIGEPLPPSIDSSNLENRTVRSGVPFSFYVHATSPNNGTLIYRWYRNDTLIAGQTGNGRNTYSPVTTPASLVGTHAEYYVKVINSVPGVQVNDTLDSEKATITVDAAPKTLTEQTTVEIDASGLTYNGEPQEPSRVVVNHAGDELQEGADFKLVYANNVNAGAGFVYVIGLDAYKDTALVNFPIKRKTIEPKDFFVNLNRTYNGSPHVLTARITDDPETKKPREHAGTPTFRYNGATAPPTNAGRYAVTVTFAQGVNFTASDSAFVLDSLVIAKKSAVAADFNYTIPRGHTYNGNGQGIGAVTLNAPLIGAGQLTVLYDYVEALPVAAATYSVAVEVEGGDNFWGGVVPLGNYRIASDTILVSEAKRNIESIGYGPVAQAAVATEAEAIAYVNGVIEAEIELAGVTATVKAVTFTAPVAGTAAVPRGAAGTLVFTVALEKGSAKDSTVALTLTITATPVSVTSGDRVIPGKADGSAVVAPVAAVAGEFSVGPNPVAKASGKVGFFWDGSPIKSGALYVYDASGNRVKKVAVAGKGAKDIGSWDMVDAKGRPVAEGAYLVKGALVTKAGGKVRVAAIVGVAK